MRASARFLCWSLAACADRGPATPAPSPDAALPPANAATASTNASALPFIRAVPPPDQRRSIDACAYPGVTARACVDALAREPDPVRARYMRRIAAAHVGRGAGARLENDVAECCNAAGAVCGAPKRSGHADCPAMDDGYACLVAAELGRAGAHERACLCDQEHARISVLGGTLACDGASAVTRAPMARNEGDDVIACASCASAAACEREIARVDAELGAFLRRVIVTRCTLP